MRVLPYSRAGGRTVRSQATLLPLRPRRVYICRASRLLTRELPITINGAKSIPTSQPTNQPADHKYAGNFRDSRPVGPRRRRGSVGQTYRDKAVALYKCRAVQGCAGENAVWVHRARGGNQPSLGACTECLYRASSSSVSEPRLSSRFSVRCSESQAYLILILEAVSASDCCIKVVKAD